jgi:hypothetical protein
MSGERGSEYEKVCGERNKEVKKNGKRREQEPIHQ